MLSNQIWPLKAKYWCITDMTVHNELDLSDNLLIFQNSSKKLWNENDNFLYSNFTLRYKIWVATFSYSKIQEKTLKCEWEILNS
jgi:hypothetical protein